MSGISGGGSDVSDIVIAGTNRWAATPWTRPTAHSAWDMTYTVAGKGRYRVRPVETTAAAGDVIIFHRDAPLEHANLGPGTWAFHYICFDVEPGWSPPPPFTPVASGVFRAHAKLTQTRQRIEDAFRRLIGDVRARDAAIALDRLRVRRASKRSAERDDARRELSLMAVREIVLHLRNDANETARLDPRVVAALQVITADLARHHDARTLARTAGLSESRFLHLFRAELGIPLRRAIRTLRLQQAASLLAYGNDPVGSIADEVGFSSIFALSREFRRAYGLSPRPYRERFRTPNVPREARDGDR